MPMSSPTEPPSYSESSLNDPSDEVSVPAGPLGREDLEDAPFWKEVAAFNQLSQQLIDEYYGQYVAVYQGNIVDSDPDEGELALRFYRTFGYVPVYIHKVGTEDGLIDADDI
jgi:hypothetical protein